MPTVYPVTMHALWVTLLGFCILGWGVTLAVHLLAKRRIREAEQQHSAPLREMALQVADFERRLDEYSALLGEARRELSEKNEQIASLEGQFEEERPTNAVAGQRLPLATIPQAALPSEPGADDDDTAIELRKLQANLSEARRSRDASEHRARKLEVTNLEQTRKISELTSRLDEFALRVEKAQAALIQERARKVPELTLQLDEVATNMEETHIMLAERERELADVTRRLSESNSQLEDVRAQVRSGEAQLLETSVRLKMQQDTNAGLNQRIRMAERAVSERQSESEEALQKQQAFTRQLEEKQAAYAALERMLQESTSVQLQLRRDLKSVTQGREDLETQNLELKMILELLGKRTVTVRPVGASGRTDESSVESRLEMVGSWEAVTETDIQQTVLDIAEVQIPEPAPIEVQAKAKPSPIADARSSELGRELQQARLRIEMLEASMADLEYLREQNARLGQEWGQDRGAARELSALQLEHKRLKLDLQLATEKLETQATSLERLSDIQAELEDRNAEQETVLRLHEQVRDLNAEIFAMRNANSGTYQVMDLGSVESSSRELTPVALDAAVLSDHLGLPIAATGSLPAESLAAVSGLAARNAEHVRELLPLGPITTIQWVDQYGMTVTCRLLKMAGDEMAMTTIGPGTPSEQTLRQTLTNVLQSIGWTEQGPVSDDDSHVATG